MVLHANFRHMERDEDLSAIRSHPAYQALLARKDAVATAETVRGVRSIVDRIEVDPPKMADDELRLDVVKALAIDPATDSYELDVAVHDGVVTIGGTVESLAEKELCLDVAAGVRGVRDVKNEITLLLQTQRPDDEILADVRRRVDMDVWTDAGPLEMDVSDGSVTVTGTVKSAAQKRRLAMNAWVAGVRDVDVSGVAVHWARRKIASLLQGPHPAGRRHLPL